MTCSTCGSNLPCPCSQQFQTGVGRTCIDPCGIQAGCNPNSCCQPSLPAAPVPFYACVPNCPENHTQTFVQQQFYFDVSAQNSWNIPACGTTAILVVPGLKSINVGSYIWDATYGFFEVTAFDITTGQLTVLNHCNAGNAAVGTTVPACTLFTITVPPCDCGDSSQVCVAIDFTAPEVDDCIDITLTATTGLTASDTVQIGTGFYFVDAIKPNNIITICNKGNGITPGTPVIAKDINGGYQYCLSVISRNPCENTPITSGPVLACDPDGVIAPLTGADVGDVLVLTNTTTGEAEYQDIIGPIETEIACAPQSSFSGVTLMLYSFPVVLDTSGPSIGTFGREIDPAVVSVLTPSDCPDAVYSVKAFVNLAGLQDHSGGGVITQEIEASWSNNGLGGRMCWTDYGDDGFDIREAYPVTGFNPIWSILEILNNGYPMMYNASYVVPSTTLLAGQTADLALTYKTTVGDNNNPSSVLSAAIYLVANVEIMRIA